MQSDFFALAKQAKFKRPDTQDPDARLALAEKRIERERRSRQHAEYLLEMKSLELSKANEKLKRAAATLEDEVEQRTEELAKTLDDARLMARTNRHLVDMVSHEIRTPLNALIGLMRMLSDEQDLNVNRDHVEMAAENAENLADLLDSLLDVSRQEQRGNKIKSKLVSLPELRERLYQRYSHAAFEKGLDFRLEPSPNTSVPIDLVRVEQICGNLISNAIKYSREGWVRLSVGLKKDKDQSYLAIEVSDTGIGLNEDQIATMFNRFEQVLDDEEADYKSSSGLGLFITKRLITMMDGDVSVTSKPGFGTAVIVTIPISMDGAETIKPAKRSDGNKSATRSLKKAEPAPKILSVKKPAPLPLTKQALIVEDSRANRLLMSKQLQALGYAVTEAESNAAAMAILTTGQTFDLAMMDLNLGDGISKPVAEALLVQSPSTRRVLVTGDVRAVEANATSMLFDDCLLKPFKPADLKAVAEPQPE